jgi:dynactin complex subunit
MRIADLAERVKEATITNERLTENIFDLTDVIREKGGMIMTKRTMTAQCSIDMFIQMSEDSHKKIVDAIDLLYHTPKHKEEIKQAFKDQFRLKMMEGMIKKLVAIIDQQDARLSDLEDHLASLSGSVSELECKFEEA